MLKAVFNSSSFVKHGGVVQLMSIYSITLARKYLVLLSLSIQNYKYVLLNSLQKRESRARKIVAKLGEKLQTVRQCQQISGCPFTFKQLRSRLKARPSITSNVPLGESPSLPSINYNYKQPGANRPNIRPSSSSGSSNAPHKGDDEIEEFYGPAPIVINRPPGFGSNQVTGHRPASSSQNGESSSYVPFNPHNKHVPTTPGPVFPKVKVGYQIPNYKKKKPAGENDEFDDVNKSTGPVTLIGDEAQQQQQQQQQQQESSNEANNDGGDGDGDGGNDYDNDNNESAEYDDDYNGGGGDDDGDYYNDGGDDNEEDGESNEDEEDEEEDDADASQEEEAETKKKKKASSKKTDGKKKQSKDKVEEDVTSDGPKKNKVVKYKNPGASSGVIVIEEEFLEKKKPGYDDELEHPDNAWSKYTFATSGATLKEPKDRVKTPLEEKNDEKLNVSTSSSENKESDKKDKEKASDENSSEEEDEEEEETEDDKKSRKRTSQLKKFEVDDDEEFEATKDFMKKYKPRRRSNPKYGGDHGAGGKRKKESEAEEKSVSAIKKDQNDKKVDDQGSSSEEEDLGPRRRQETTLTHIGGVPIVPPPEKNKQNQKKVWGLGRFKFNLVRPQGNSDDDEPQQQQLTPSLTSYKFKTRTSLPKTQYEPSYTSPSSSSSSSSKKDKKKGSSKSSRPSYSSSSKPESSTSATKDAISSNTGSHGEGYIPAVSFGSSNGGKLGTVEYLGAPSSQTQAKPSIISFPFSNPLTSIKSLFQRGGSSGSGNQDIPTGHQQQQAPVSAFVHRPVGPESNSYRRLPSRNRSDAKSKSKKGKGKSSSGASKKGKKSGSKKYTNRRRN
jgi:hypothetical protein